LNNSHAVLFNTIASNYRLFYRLQLRSTVLVRIHNSNAYFKSLHENYKPRFTLFYLMKDISHFIRNTLFKLDWYHRKIFLSQADYYVFPSKIIREFAINMLGIRQEKTISLPFSYASHPSTSYATTNTNESPVTITIIGKLDQRNRDYEMLYRVFQKLGPFLTNSKYPIRLIFLGSATTKYGKKIVNLFTTIINDNFSLVSFKDFVEQEQFIKYINQTDFLILPINIKTRYAVYDESYGHTKISGNINDIIKYQKPALIPAEYPLENKLKLITESFKDENELAAKIQEWCTDQKFRQFDFEKSLINYQLAATQKRYLEVIRKAIDNSNNNLANNPIPKMNQANII